MEFTCQTMKIKSEQENIVCIFLKTNYFNKPGSRNIHLWLFLYFEKNKKSNNAIFKIKLKCSDVMAWCSLPTVPRWAWLQFNSVNYDTRFHHSSFCMTSVGPPRFLFQSLFYSISLKHPFSLKNRRRRERGHGELC